VQSNLAEAERRIQDAQRTQTEWLDLGDLALSELPASLGDLQHLKVLYLGGIGLNAAGEPERLDDRESPQFTDLSPLSSLGGLQSLHLQYCYRATDLSPLSGLTGLQSLDLQFTRVADLSPLSGLSSLKSLNLWKTDTTDLSPLSGLIRLQSLDLTLTEVKDLSPLSGLAGLQSLDLSDTPVTDLHPLLGLTGLQSLSLDGCLSMKDFSQLSGLTWLQSLELSVTNINDLSPLSDLTALLSLNLRQTDVKSLSPLAGLAGLQSLILSRTKVTDLSPLSSLSRLQSLNLSFTRVKDLSPLTGLTQLKNLDFYECPRLTNLSPLSNLTGLQSLNLQECLGVRDLSPLSNLPELQRLDLRECRNLRNFPSLLSTGIQSLELLNTKIRDLSPLASLTGLQRLNLGNTGVRNLSPLSSLIELRSLELSGTRVTNLSPLSSFTKLQRLDLAGTRVMDLSPLSSLIELQSLSLLGTKVTDLSPLSGLSRLRQLDLQGCRCLTDLSPLPSFIGLQVLDIFGCGANPTDTQLRSFAEMPHLEYLLVAEADETSHIPEEIFDPFENCLPGLRTYFSELDLGPESENLVRVILLGNSRVGKTQLCRRFRGQPFGNGVTPTHGVQIWLEKLRVRTGDKEQTFQIHWWDFGGQDIYYGTPSLFLRSPAIFLILWMPGLESWEESSDENGAPMRNQPLTYWLDYVRSFAGEEDSPVIAVQSQCDRFADQSNDLPKLEGFRWSRHCSYSAKTDLGSEALEAQLRDAIRFLLEQNGTVQIDHRQARVRRELYDWRSQDQELKPEKREHRTLPLKEFRSLCRRVGGRLPWEQTLDHFHQTGVVFYRPDLFENVIVLDQDWVLDAIYAVFSRGQAVPWLRDSGRFTLEDLAETVWQGYSSDERRFFLSLMESCKACFPCGRGFQGEIRYVAPDLLPRFEAISSRVNLVWNESLDTPVLRMEYRFFQPDLIRGLMSAVGQHAEDLAEYWKYGLWLKDGQREAQLLVQVEDAGTFETPGAGALVLKAQGGDPLGLLREIRKTILQRRTGEATEELLTLNGVTVARSALSTLSEGRVPDSRREWVTSAAFASFFEDLKELHVDHEQQDVSIDPQPLRSDEKPREVFISYAWGDETPEGKIRGEAIEHLFAALVQDGFHPVRDKDRIQAGELISAFIRQLTRADHVVAIISDKYLRSPYCMYEIYMLWQRCQGDAKELAARVVPVVLPDVRIKNLRERLPYLQYWADEAEALEALVRNPKISPSQESWEEVRLVRQFAQHVDEILVFLQDVLVSRNLETHFENGFEAVRVALRRRVTDQ
jgi:internalin A